MAVKSLLKKLPFKKDEHEESELKVPETSGHGLLGEAERVSNVVSAGLEQNNYPEMNKQLATLAVQEKKAARYVFEGPGIVVQTCAVAACAALGLLCCYCLVFSIGTLILSTHHYALGAALSLSALAGALVNGALVLRFAKTVRFRERYDSYEEMLGYRSLELVEDIADYAKQPEAVVIEDLNRAVDLKLIPQGHFSRGNLAFMVSDGTFEKYEERQDAYDRYFQKKLEERRRIESRPESIQKILEDGEASLAKIRACGSLVKGKAVAQKLARLEKTTAMIFHEVDVNPDSAQSLGVFLNYYLPTTEKLLDTYASLVEKKASGKAARETKKEIESALDTVATAFGAILEQLYQENEASVRDDIETMEMSMMLEGLSTQP